MCLLYNVQCDSLTRKSNSAITSSLLYGFLCKCTWMKLSSIEAEPSYPTSKWTLYCDLDTGECQPGV